jgi:predicted nuclease of predicted toxin-antitoxin system
VKILVDESLPRYLKQALPEHEAFTVQDMGWTGIRNSELLAKAESGFDVLLTADKNLRYQQNLRGLVLGIIVFPSNRLSIVKALIPRLKRALLNIKPGEVIEL